MATILLVDDNERFLDSLERALASEYSIRKAKTLEEARASLTPPPDAVMLDLRLDEHRIDVYQGIDLLRELRQDLPHVPVLVMTAYGDVETAVRCMQMGAVDFIAKGGDVRELRVRVHKALEQARLSSRVAELEHELEIIEPRKLIGDSEALAAVRNRVAGAASDGNITVLITGETGTGKELIARAIHASGKRSSRPFMPVVVGDLPTSMAEGQLFGYEAGAFTDARKRHAGFLERAHGGVLFLDEVGELDVKTQVRLLRFLEERSFTRLGGHDAVSVDVQVVAATNADLDGLSGKGLFREDLLYRLKVFEIRLPPLRERKEDIPALAKFFLKQCQNERKGPCEISPEVLNAFTECPWPGNVRQLKHSVQSAYLMAAMAGNSRIGMDDLPETVTRRPARSGLVEQVVAKEKQGPVDLDRELARCELRHVETALSQVAGQKTAAWKLLGLNDRFALRRRVTRIFEQFPDLATEFGRVADAYAKRTDDADPT